MTPTGEVELQLASGQGPVPGGRPQGEEPEIACDALRSLLDAAAAGSLLTSVVHGGNNRLTVILSCLDLLHGAELNDPDLRSAIALATGAAQQLADDFALLLGGVRRKSPHGEGVALDAVLDRARALDALLHDGSIVAECDAAPGLGVAADRDPLVAAVLRVLLLARRRGAGSVRIRAREFDVETRTLERPTLRKGRYCRLEFVLVGAALPEALARTPAEFGHVVARLEHADGLEFAAVEAFVGALRGQVATSSGLGAATIELYLPAPARSA
jgi:nitrogen-specific signal transduction histidine kinase